MKPKGSQFGPQWHVDTQNRREDWYGGSNQRISYSLHDPNEMIDNPYSHPSEPAIPVRGQIRTLESNRLPRYNYDQHYANDDNQMEGQRALFGVNEHGKSLYVSTAFTQREHAAKAGKMFGYLVNRAQATGARLEPDSDLSQHSGGLVNRAIDAGLIDPKHTYDESFDNGYTFEDGPVDFIHPESETKWEQIPDADLRAGMRTVRNIVKAGRPPKKMRGEQELPF